MKFAWALLHASAVAQFLPLGAAALKGRAAWRGPRGLILAWVLLGGVVNVVMFVNRQPGNAWIYNASIPVAGALVLWALSGWHTAQLAKQTLRIAALAFAVIAVALLFVPGQVRRPDSMAASMFLFLALGTSAWTLVARGTKSNEPLLRQDWFWICGGLTLYFGENSTLGQFLHMADPSSPLLLWAVAVEAVGDIIAMLAIAWGMTLVRGNVTGTGMASLS